MEHLKEMDLVLDYDMVFPIQLKISDLKYSRALKEGKVDFGQSVYHVQDEDYMPIGMSEGDGDHDPDIWSLGVLYYRMVTGFTPFTSIGQEQLLH